VKVPTCKTGKQSCRTGRGWGCLGRGKTKKGKWQPRWVKAVCETPAPSQTSQAGGHKRKLEPELWADPGSLPAVQAKARASARRGRYGRPAP
jgi:hypothetical protein